MGPQAGAIGRRDRWDILPEPAAFPKVRSRSGASVTKDMAVPQVLLIQRRLTGYRVQLFERVRDLLAESGVRLVVLHGTPAREELSRLDAGSLVWAVRARTRYPLGGTRPSWLRIPAPILAASDLVILPHELGFLPNYPILLGRPAGPRIAFWGHGPRLEAVRLAFRDTLKGAVARRADWWFAYTKLSLERYVAAGVAPDRITRLDNSAPIGPPVGAPAPEILGRDPVLAPLARLGPSTAVYVGALTPEKRLDFLIEAADELRRRLEGFQLVIVGDGPLRGWLEEKARTRPWVHAVGARKGLEKAAICATGRVFLNPGMVGLGILDAFACGLPVVTARGDFHSPEIAYLEHGVNGLMIDGDPVAFAGAAESILTDERLYGRLAAGCREAAGRYTLENMAKNFSEGILSALGPRPGIRQRTAAPTTGTNPFARRIAVVVRSFLPYHVARLARLRARCEREGISLLAVEVASMDAAYRFPGSAPPFPHVCCFPGRDFQNLKEREVREAVLDRLEEFAPDVVFGPATPFPEGMAGITYRERSGARYFLMDDAWERTDATGPAKRLVKRLLHQNVDGAFVPSVCHVPYFEGLGVARERIVLGVDAVDNEAIAAQAARARANASVKRAALGLPGRYLLFVGRFLERKGLGLLLSAYARYRAEAREPCALLLVGGAPAELPPGVALPPGATVIGRRFGEELASVLGLAKAVVVPSLADPWALVVNEAMAAGTPAIVSDGCGAAALVEDGVNGWTFPSGDEARLAELLREAADAGADERAAMIARASATISEWGLDRHVDAVFEAIRVERAPPAGLAGAVALRLWKGRVRVY